MVELMTLDRSISFVALALALAFFAVQYSLKSLPPWAIYLLMGAAGGCTVFGARVVVPPAYAGPWLLCIPAGVLLGWAAGWAMLIGRDLTSAPIAAAPPAASTAVPAPPMREASPARPRAAIAPVKVHNSGDVTASTGGVAVGHGAGTVNIYQGPAPEEREVETRRAEIVAIVHDYMSTHDGIQPTEAGVLDQSTDYINTELRRRERDWLFTLEERRRLGFPPPL